MTSSSLLGATGGISSVMPGQDSLSLILCAEKMKNWYKYCLCYFCLCLFLAFLAYLYQHSNNYIPLGPLGALEVDGRKRWHGLIGAFFMGAVLASSHLTHITTFLLHSYPNYKTFYLSEEMQWYNSTSIHSSSNQNYESLHFLLRFSANRK